MRLRLIALGLSLASSVGAQAPGRRTITLGFRPPVGRSSTPANITCDNSAFEAVERKKKLGNVLLYGGGAVAAAGLYSLQNSNFSTAGIPFVTGGLLTSFAGGYIKNSADDPEAMDRVVSSLKVGETKASDVSSCLGKPRSTTTRNGSEETWTYLLTKTHSKGGFAMYLVPVIGPLFANSGGTDMRSVTLTFKNGVLSDVSKTATGF